MSRPQFIDESRNKIEYNKNFDQEGYEDHNF
jgi:hypothetical protein